MTGRPLVSSSAAMAAPRAQPPNRKGPGVEIAGVTGRTQRMGLCVGSRPSQVRASIGGDCRHTPSGGRQAAPYPPWSPPGRRAPRPGAGATARRPDWRSMTDTPWLGDACSLVDAFRAGERKPSEELEAVLAAIERSELNAVSFVDEEGARAAVASADVSLPFGGVPIGVKELEPVAGWPATEASLVFADRVADHTTTMVRRLEAAGVVKVAQTTASEFGGLNVSVSRLHGVTHNPWAHGRTAGG